MGLGPAELSFTILDAAKLPLATSPRWAVLGRSNVGKSSFLNALIHPKVMFKTSRHAGKTTGLIGAKIKLGQSEKSTLELVDVPGFGFAVAQKSDRERWEELLNCLKTQSHEIGLMWIWLVDPTRQPGLEDTQLKAWLNNEPYVFVFTKADKVKESSRAQSEKIWKDYILSAAEGPFWVSSLKGSGLNDLQKSARNFVRACHE